MRITHLADFLKLTNTELAEVTEPLLKDDDLNVEVVRRVAEEGVDIEFNVYETKIVMNDVRKTIHINMAPEGDYNYLLGIIGSKLARECIQLRTLVLDNCGIGLYDAETQNFFADLQHCRQLEVLNLPNNALCGMTDWCNAFELFRCLRLLHLDLSSNDLFNSNVWEETGDDTNDSMSMWLDILNSLDECKTLKTLNLASNCFESAVRNHPEAIITLLTHMIVISGTELNLDNNELEFLTSKNLQLLRATPHATAAGATAVDVSNETLMKQLHSLIKREIAVHDELDFDINMFRALDLTSSVPRPIEAQRVKTASLIGYDSSISLTTTESRSPVEQQSQDASARFVSSLDQGCSSENKQAKRRFVKVGSLPKTISQIATERSLALLQWTSDLAFSETKLASSVDSQPMPSLSPLTMFKPKRKKIEAVEPHKDPKPFG